MSRTELDIHVMGPSGHHEFNFEIIRIPVLEHEVWGRLQSHRFLVYYCNNGSYLRQDNKPLDPHTYAERGQAEQASQFADSESAKGGAYAFVNQKTGGDA